MGSAFLCSLCLPSLMRGAAIERARHFLPPDRPDLRATNDLQFEISGPDAIPAVENGAGQDPDSYHIERSRASTRSAAAGTEVELATQFISEVLRQLLVRAPVGRNAAVANWHCKVIEEQRCIA